MALMMQIIFQNRTTRIVLEGSPRLEDKREGGSASLPADNGEILSLLWRIEQLINTNAIGGVRAHISLFDSTQGKKEKKG